jgi:glycosyltransferase involved in cell wall biosynthesis
MQFGKILSAIPPDTGLEMVIDHRSGNKLELVIPVFNEEFRLGYLIEAYSKIVDIVLLDGGSTDSTINLAEKHKLTVFIRNGKENVGENHFIYYVNKHSKSGRCLYFFADEGISIRDLNTVDITLKQGNTVMAYRVDWVMGRSMVYPSCIIPKGVCKGAILYDSSNLHGSMKPTTKTGNIIVTVHHFQVYKTAHDYGKIGNYINTEVQQYLVSNNFYRNFFRRYIFSEIIMRPRGIWRARKLGVTRGLWGILLSLTIPLLAFMNLIEIRLGMTIDSQRLMYAKLFHSIL